MTRDEAVDQAWADSAYTLGTVVDRREAFLAKLRECGFWIAPMEVTSEMLHAVFGTVDRDNAYKWDWMRSAYEENAKAQEDK